jgi:hypothetical protein
MYNLINSVASIDVQIHLAKDETWEVALASIQRRLQTKELNVMFQLLHIDNTATKQLMLIRFTGSLTSVYGCYERLKKLPRYIAIA